MPQTSRPNRKSMKAASRDWPVVVYVWAGALGFAGYVVARIALDGQPHPLHWASGIAGAALGIGIGWLWYRWKGDVI